MASNVVVQNRSFLTQIAISGLAQHGQIPHKQSLEFYTESLKRMNSDSWGDRATPMPLTNLVEFVQSTKERRKRIQSKR
jgi:hypothetical protein